MKFKCSDFLSDDLVRHASILFSGSMVVNVSNFLFQMAVSRALPANEFALLIAFLGVLTIIQRPLSTLRVAVNHYSSLLCQDGRVGDVKRLLRKWIILTGIFAAVLGAVFIIFNDSLAGFLHLERSAPILIVGAVVPALFLLPVLGGAGQGMQLFKWYSFSVILGALIRLGLGAGFVWFLYPACGWAMLGHGLSLYITAVVLLLSLLFVLRGQPVSLDRLPSMRGYLLQGFFVLAAYAVLMTADVVLVKHYLPEDVEFAYAATLSKMVLFFPGAIVSAMFPKVASRGVGSTGQQQIFLKSLKLTAVFVVVVAVGCASFPGLLVRTLFGITDASVYLKRMIGLMSIVMVFSSLLNVTVQFLLAQRRFNPAFATIGFALLYLIGVFLFHQTTWHVASMAAVCNGGALFVGLVMIVKPGWFTLKTLKKVDAEI